MKSENKLVKEAISFLGWGMLTGSTRAAFEKCESIDEMLNLVPACTRKYAKVMIDKLKMEDSPDLVLFISLGILADTDFADCARHFEGELSKNLIQLEGLVHGN